MITDQVTSPSQSPSPAIASNAPVVSYSEPRNLSERTQNALTRVGDNIDLINLYARLKDGYRLFEVLGNFLSIGLSNAFASRLNPNKDKINDIKSNVNRFDASIEQLTKQHDILSKNLEAIEKTDVNQRLDVMTELHRVDNEVNLALKERQELKNILRVTQNDGRFYGNVLADSMNAIAQLCISGYSAWWERKSLVHIFDGYIKQEQGVTNVSYNHLKHSTNPIIQRATSYYDRKDTYRTLPDYLGFVRVIPMIGRMIGQNSKFYQATKWMEGISGITLSLGAKTGFFAWYFLERQTGGYYQLKRIWNKTEGILSQDNRMYNQSITPGELVTQEEIAKVYREVAHDRKLQDFGRDDPLTGRIFAQIALYLNHNYIPKLLRDKKADLNTKELEQTKFSFADLVELFGTAGININDAYATAVRIEALAHGGFRDYREVDEKLKRFTRPEKTSYATQAEFREALTQYMNKLDEIACDYLGEQNWPKEYVVERIRPGLFVSHGVEPDYKFVKPERLEAVQSKLSIKKIQSPPEELANPPQPILGEHTAKVLQSLQQPKAMDLLGVL